MTDSGPVTTAGVIAVGNLEARIDGQLSRAMAGRLTVDERGELIELIALRGHVMGRIADAERAAAMADELVEQVPNDARSFLARARMRGVFHRFASALTDLDTAAALGGDRADLDAERAAIYQALGRYDEALAIRRLAIDGRADFSTLAALAGSLRRARGAARGGALVHGGDTLLPWHLAVPAGDAGTPTRPAVDGARRAPPRPCLVRCGSPPAPGLRPRAGPPRRARRCPRRDGGGNRPPAAAGARIRRPRLRDAARPNPGRHRPHRGGADLAWQGTGPL